MSDSTFPPGPLPADASQAIGEIIRLNGLDIGVNAIRRHLEIKYSTDFTAAQSEIQNLALEVLKNPEFASVIRASATTAKGGKKKRARSPSDKPKTEKKAKKEAKSVKPDNYPKKNSTAFFIFMGEYRETAKKENPDIAFTQIGKDAGEKWKSMSDAEKAPYEKKAAEDKERYEREMKAYLAGGGAVYKKSKGKVTKKAAKAAKDPNAPKRSLSAYMFFANDFRTKHPELKMTEQMSAAGVAWKALSDEEKAPFEKKAADDKARYQKELETYKSGSGASASKGKAAAAAASSSSDSSSDSSDDDSSSEDDS